MFIRRKKNKSGLVRIQVTDKSSGKYYLVKTIGSSSNSVELEELKSEAVLWIKR